jgi:hypothetical protein
VEEVVVVIGVVEVEEALVVLEEEVVEVVEPVEVGNSEKIYCIKETV